jgi:FlaA1/EpsC-like NDP-sugar epimerase
MKEFLLNLTRLQKRLLLILVDVVTISLALWLSLSIRQDSFFNFSDGYELTGATSLNLYSILLLANVTIITSLILFRLYRSITRYISIETYVKITKASTIGTGLWALIVYNLHLPFPRSVFIIFFIFSTSLLFLTRYTARSFLTQQKENAKHAVLIYGTSQEAIEINNILKGSQSILSKGFISNDSDDTKTMIAELPVYTLKDIEKVISKKNIREILITHSDQSKNKLKLIVKELDKHHGIIRKLPNIKDLATGTIKLSQIEKIDIDDLLGRDAVKPNEYLLKACIQNKTVLVTGAGGSIGSELCRQIICLNPKKIILLEQSEYFLYEIDREICDIKLSTNLNVDISTYMGSVGDESLVKHIFRNENIDTVYHAAANKHVPLVEHNPLSAIKNNIIGTHTVATAAYKHNVENFVLISSDKAVRPTNIMGATKRFAELILQSLQDIVDDMSSNKCKTKYCMVRFGNVLDTSGSVVPLFKKQIRNGGPVTVTDPRVIRYFMTISEATELVIQAGSLSKGGDVFLLDMGEPLSILELAKEMIKLSGKEIKDENNPAGDIEISFTGLRDGEKLYEELLIGDDVSKTTHDHIMSANEEKLTHHQIEQCLDKFKELDSESSTEDIKKILYESVAGYDPYSSEKVIKFPK